jgi:VWFA-related protein
MRPSQIAFLATSIWLLFAAPAAQAQSALPATQQSPQPTLRTGANLVVVDVVATDHDRPVHDLGRPAFHIFEDGKEQTISSFEEHRPAANLPQYLASPLPANTYSNAPVYSKSPAVNVLLLDALNTPVSDQLRVRQKMIQYLAAVKPGTPLAIFALSTQLRMVTDFTTDAGALAREVKNPKANPQESALLNTPQANDLNATEVNAVSGVPPGQSVAGDSTVSPTAGLANRPGVGPGPASAVEALQQFEADQAAFQIEVRAKITLSAMQQLAGYLRGVEGRKNVIWFSEAFPLSVFPDSTAFDPFANVASYREQIQKTANLLTAARVAIYPVDARGLMLPFGVNASNRTPTPNQSLSRSVAQDDEEQHNEQAAMQEVAEDTGGRAYINTNDLDKAIADAVDNGSSYYTITYALPSERLDGKYHKLEVRVDGEHGMKLTYRRGFYADALDKTPADGPETGVFATALAPDAPEATAILLKARILPAADPVFSGVSLPEGSAGQHFFPFAGAPHRYIVDLTIDPNGLVFTAAPNGDLKAPIEIGIIAYASDGRHLNDYSHGFQLALKTAQLEKLKASGISVRLPFDLPPGNVDLRIGVHDLNVDRAGSLDIPMQVAQ